MAGPGADRGARSLGRLDWSTWPTYESAALGFRNYWYPVLWSREVGRRPRQVTVAGDRIVLSREAGIVRASPIPSNVAVRTYPVEERIGIVWIFLGEGDPPPVEADIPESLLESDSVVCGRITRRSGNWRFGAENGFDEGHAKYLHRKSLWAWRTELPVWIQIHMDQRGPWLTRVSDKVHFAQEYPGLGTWPPRKAPWRHRGKRGPTVGIRLPGILRVAYREWDHFEWWVPEDGERHHYIQIAATRARGWPALRFRLYYWLLVRWIFHGLFNDEDALMVDVMDAPPERLYRPDKAIIAWREMCETQARQPDGVASERTAGPEQSVA